MQRKYAKGLGDGPPHRRTERHPLLPLPGGRPARGTCRLRPGRTTRPLHPRRRRSAQPRRPRRGPEGRPGTHRALRRLARARRAPQGARPRRMAALPPPGTHPPPASPPLAPRCRPARPAVPVVIGLCGGRRANHHRTLVRLPLVVVQQRSSEITLPKNSTAHPPWVSPTEAVFRESSAQRNRRTRGPAGGPFPATPTALKTRRRPLGGAAGTAPWRLRGDTPI